MKKQHESDIWLDKVRIALYEETKDMTATERTAYLKAKVAPIHEQYNFHVVSRIPGTVYKTDASSTGK
jgi:hypothetical protein